MKPQLKTPTEWMSATFVNDYSGSFGCPRKIYYKKVIGLKGKPSINFPIGNRPDQTIDKLMRKGTIYHLTDYEEAKAATLKQHDEIWFDKIKEFDIFKLSADEMQTLLNESREMMINWLNFYWSITPRDPTPAVQVTHWDRKNMMNARPDWEYKKTCPGPTYITDFKSGRKNVLWDDIKLQLILQWLCYKAATGSTNHVVGAHFLRFPEAPKYWTPTQAEIDWALDKVKYVRKHTRSTDLKDYPCTCGGRCQKDFIHNEPSNQRQNPETQAQGRTPQPEKA